jgi:dihydrofolate synthase/folylpolyglutamate synthase
MTVIFGVSSGKDIDGIFNELLPQADKVIFTQHSSSTRRVNPQELNEFVRQNKAEYLVKCSVISDCETALDTAIENAAGNELICITGSLFLAAELSERFRR